MRTFSDGFSEPPHDLLLVGGRVIDPETGLDAVRNVGMRDGRISYVGESLPASAETIDATSLVVAPGFIDLHSHALDLPGMYLQVLDGVTTALDLESGAAPAGSTYAHLENERRPINFGFSAAWTHARMHVLDGVELVDPANDPGFVAPVELFSIHQGGPRWREPASSTERASILEVVREQIENGAIGIGALLGYVPHVDAAELRALAELAAGVGQPLFVHSRSMAQSGTDTAADAVQELADLALATGVHIHLCHLNSTSGRLADAVTRILEDARGRGATLTTETYPYSAGSTAIGAAFLAPDQLERNGLTASSIVYLPTGERVADVERLGELRESDPGGSCLVEFLDEANPDDAALFLRALTLPGAAIASDAVSIVYSGGEQEKSSAEKALRATPWHVPTDYITHPRSAGTFSKSISWLSRELGVLGLADVIERATLIPARILERAVPAMARKGRVQVGADADIVVFDADTVGPAATYDRVAPSVGFRHVFVAGTAVVTNGAPVPGALPGRAIRGSRTTPLAPSLEEITP